MPLVRIDISKDAPADLIKTIGDSVYDAMTEIAKVPVNDRFQIVNRHTADELIYPADGYLGVNYTPGIIFIQITWVSGRATEVKKAFYKKIAEDITAKGRVRKEDIFISLVEAGREDWSFGNGEMQYAPVHAQ